MPCAARGDRGRRRSRTATCSIAATGGDVGALDAAGAEAARPRARHDRRRRRRRCRTSRAYLRDDRVNHVVVGDELDHGVFVTAQKLLTGDIFGIEKYLPEGTPVHYARLRDFEGRGKAIETVLDFAEESKMRRQVRSAIGQVCEELLMNALYDAPVDADGKPVFAEVDPHDRTKTRSPRPVSIRYAATDEHVRGRGARSVRPAREEHDPRRTSTSASTRRTRSIARPTARASACTSSRTRRRRTSSTSRTASRPRSCARSIAARRRRCGSSACSCTPAARRC